MIIDSHIHYAPAFVAENPTAWSESRGEPYWLSCVAPKSGPKLQGWVSEDRLLQDMDEAGIEKAVVLSWYWENHDTCEQEFAWQRELVKRHPDRLLAFAPFNAKGQQKAIDLLKEACDAGFRGIGELNPPAQGYAYDDPYLDRALQLAHARDLLVNIHVTEPAGHNYPGKIETPYPSLIALAKRHPKVRFIFAHLGGLLALHEVNGYTKKALQNVWYDTAAIPLLYELEVYRAVCDQVGHGRILFGTDYPLRTFPKLQKEPDFRCHLAQLRQTDLNEDQLDAILGANMKQLLELK